MVITSRVNRERCQESQALVTIADLKFRHWHIHWGSLLLSLMQRNSFAVSYTKVKLTPSIQSNPDLPDIRVPFASSNNTLLAMRWAPISPSVHTISTTRQLLFPLQMQTHIFITLRPFASLLPNISNTSSQHIHCPSLSTSHTPGLCRLSFSQPLSQPRSLPTVLPSALLKPQGPDVGFFFAIAYMQRLIAYVIPSRPQHIIEVISDENCGAVHGVTYDK